MLRDSRVASKSAVDLDFCHRPYVRSPATIASGSATPLGLFSVQHHLCKMPTFKRIVLAQRPKGPIDATTFRTEAVELPPANSLKPEEVLLKIQHLSIEPGSLCIRYFSGASY